MNWLNNLFQGVGKAASSFGQYIPQIMSAFNPGPVPKPAGQWPNLSQGNGGGGGGGPQPFNAFSQSPRNSIQGVSSINGGTMPAKPKKTNFLDTIFSGGKENGLLGMGLNLIGEFAGPKVGKVPDMSSIPSVQAMKNFNVRETQPLSPDVEGSINRSVDIEHAAQTKRLRDIYKNARPGTDYTTDSAYQRDLANLERSQTLNRSDAMANASMENMRIQLGANEQEMAKLSELAQLDIGTIMANLGMDAEEANSFKEMFSNLGQPFLQKGLGLDYGSVLKQFAGV